ncbi:hypothetical protein LCGC14_2571370 [marine sediment metagenome]|uniref:Uncharacterized protein n=1 Tax=marine sediment metagenome TaxID=412755 RepID=A0A0F9AHL8_9ZZZZ
MTEHLRSNKRSDVTLAQLAFDTVMKVRSEGRKKHVNDDGDNKDVGYNLLRANSHNHRASWRNDKYRRMHIEHELTRSVMALLALE